MSSFYTTETCRPAFANKPLPLISYGLRFPEACAHHAKTTFHNASRIYIIASASLSKNTDALKRLQTALGGKVVGTRVGMKPHTLWSDVLAIVAEAEPLRPDLIVTLGAGSLTDGAKWVALAIANGAKTNEELWAMCTVNPHMRRDLRPSAIPIISIPTSLSGGEYQDRGGATEDSKHAKRTIKPPTPIKGPALVIQDPELTATTPEWVWLSTGVRAVDHCVETLCSLEGKNSCDDAAEKGLGALVPALLKCKQDPHDLEARHQCQMGAIDAMDAASNGVPMGASHGIGHQLGPLGVGHGETSCILLPAVCKFNKAKGANGARQERPREVLLRDGLVREMLKKRGMEPENADLGDVLDAVIRELGMPRTLKEKNVGRDQLDKLAVNSLEDAAVKTNPYSLTKKEQLLEILEMVIGD